VGVTWRRLSGNQIGDRRPATTWPVAAGVGAAAEFGRLYRADAVTAYFARCSADQSGVTDMPKFEDQLYAGPMREHGSALADARLPRRRGGTSYRAGRCWPVVWAAWPLPVQRREA
jgi:hypothetical protein